MEQSEINSSQKEIFSLERLLEALRNSFLQETNCNPNLPFLKSKEKASGFFLRKTSKLITSLFSSKKDFSGIKILDEVSSYSQPSLREIEQLAQFARNPYSSCWGIYARLNLQGQKEEDEKDENFYQAVRYSHIFFAKDTLPTTFPPAEEEIIKAVKETFENNQFPWKTKEGNQPVKDPRLEGVDFSPKIIKIDSTINLESIIAFGDNSPTVLLISEDFEEDPNQIGFLVNKLLARSPFVLVIKKEGEITTFQLVANHEFFDGVPAAYYLKNILERLGFTLESIKNIEAATLQNLLTKADQRETPNPDKRSQPFRVRSIVLSDQLVEQLNKLYQEILKNANQMGIDRLSYETFIQLFIFWTFGVDGENIKGGSLRFNQQIETQLEHYDVGNIILVFKALLEKNKEYLQREGYLFEKDGRLIFSLARAGKENISNIIPPLRKLPPKFWPILNEISKKTGAAVAIAGQLMTSVIPAKINGEELGGIGGPAMTEYQSTAFTISIIPDQETNLPARIILRVKEKVPKET